MKDRTIGMIGGGSWATAMVKILLDGGLERVLWWVRSEEACQSLNEQGRNPRHLQEVEFGGRVEASTNLAEVVEASSLLFVGVPSAYVEQTLSQLPREAYAGKQFVSLTKGTLPEKPMSVSMYLERELGVAWENICVVSGPSHAEEVADEKPTFLTVASRCDALGDVVEQMIAGRYIHTSRTDDVDGVERCGLIKNIYAIAAGMCQGLGYGDNVNASLTAAAFREMSHLIESQMPNARRDLNQSCYLGDLMVTCWSRHSRNRALGVALAEGKSVEEAFEQIGTTAEGYFSVLNLHKIAQIVGLQMPIVEGVYSVLYEAAKPAEVIDNMICHVL